MEGESFKQQVVCHVSRIKILILVR